MLFSSGFHVAAVHVQLGGHIDPCQCMFEYD